MRNHFDHKRGFVIASESWYFEGADKRIFEAKGWTEEITVGLYDKSDGGTSGEMAFRWHRLPGAAALPAVRLDAYHDSWSALWSFRDLLECLAATDRDDVPGPTPKEFVELLKRLGFEDRTKRTR